MFWLPCCDDTIMEANPWSKMGYASRNAWTAKQERHIFQWLSLKGLAWCSYRAVFIDGMICTSIEGTSICVRNSVLKVDYRNKNVPQLSSRETIRTEDGQEQCETRRTDRRHRTQAAGCSMSTVYYPSPNKSFSLNRREVCYTRLDSLSYRVCVVHLQEHPYFEHPNHEILEDEKR